MARDWRTTMRAASFRGAPFHVDDDGPRVGRRVAVHEISAGEFAVTEDMGAMARSVSVTAYVAGDRADAEGLALEAACGAPGPAMLILPIDPPRLVHCVMCERQRRKDQAGFIAYRLDFVEAGGAGGFAGGAIGMLAGLFSTMLPDASSGLSGLFR